MGSFITSFPMTNSLWVILHILWKAVSHIFVWPTVCEWHCTFCERQSHHIFRYDQQQVSNVAHFVKGNLITSFPMTNRLWVTLHILWKAVTSHILVWPTACEWHCTFLWKGVSSYLFLLPTACEWHCTFCERQSHHIFCYDQQGVSDILHLVKGSLITSFGMPNRLWVTLHILWKVVTSEILLSPTVCERHCTFCERQFHHIFSYDQQQVSDIACCVKGSFITSFIWPTACEWYCTFCERLSHHFCYYDQQQVRDIAHFVKGSLITSFSMTNSKWVALHILWKAVTSHPSLWPTACEWHCTFCEGQSQLSSHLFLWPTACERYCTFVKGSLITSFTMTNSKSVTLHILWKAVSSLLFLWPTVCEWHCTFCERQSCHYDQQYVSDIVHFVKSSLITSFLMINRRWVTLHIL